MEKMESYRNSQDAPMRKLILAANESEPRHLLKSDEWPDDYVDADLEPLYHKILQEYAEKSGDRAYFNAISDRGDELNNELKFKQLQYLDYLFTVGFGLIAKEIIDENKFKYKTHDAVKREMNKMKDRANIKKAREGEKKEKHQQSFEEMCVDIEMAYDGKIRIENDITVARFAAYQLKLKNRKKK